MLRIRFACLCAGAFMLLLLNGARAHAYDLSRADLADADTVERGFVVGQVNLWFPAFGSYSDYHQLSLEFGGEFGIRFASIRGEHNLFFVAGLSVSPQLLDPNEVPDRDHRGTSLVLGYGGIRYVPGMLCFGDGLGCPFAELRLGAVFESADDRSHHSGPKGDFTVLPGFGYRFRFGSSFQLGARVDIAYSGEDDESGLSWVTFGSFLGFGW
jgi:hypothetical protein